MGVLRPAKQGHEWPDLATAVAHRRGRQTTGARRFNPHHSQAAESPGIDKAQLLTRGQLQHRVSVFGHCNFRRARSPGGLSSRDAQSIAHRRPLFERLRRERCKSKTMCLPTRRTCRIRACSSTEAISEAVDFSGSGFSPSQTDSMTSPAIRWLSPRAIVSTSGSSGINC